MEKEKTNEKSQGLSKVLGPMHIWALGVGIVLDWRVHGGILRSQKEDRLVRLLHFGR